MKTIIHLLIQFFIILLFLISCKYDNYSQIDVINNPYLEYQEELKEVVNSIKKDIMTSNIEGLQSIHLKSDKFTKFGPRSFERQDVESTNKSERTFFSSISNVNYEIKDLKINVFGEIGIVTYYPYVSFVKDGNAKNVTGRQTLVFLKTNEGWKIIHEHGTIKTTSDTK